MVLHLEALVEEWLQEIMRILDLLGIQGIAHFLMNQKMSITLISLTRKADLIYPKEAGILKKEKIQVITSQENLEMKRIPEIEAVSGMKWIQEKEEIIERKGFQRMSKKAMKRKVLMMIQKGLGAGSLVVNESLMVNVGPAGMLQTDVMIQMNHQTGVVVVNVKAGMVGKKTNGQVETVEISEKTGMKKKAGSMILMAGKKKLIIIWIKTDKVRNMTALVKHTVIEVIEVEDCVAWKEGELVEVDEVLIHALVHIMKGTKMKILMMVLVFVEDIEDVEVFVVGVVPIAIGKVAQNGEMTILRVV